MASNLKQAINKGLTAARANLIPGIVIWLLAAGVIAGWHWSPWFASCLDELSLLKNKSSYLFAFISTAIAGGIIPGVVQGIFRLHPKAWSMLLWVTLFWAIKGLEINAFYELQAYFFGNNNDVTTIVYKTIFDQLIYIPIWAVPSMIIGYAWIERGNQGVVKIIRNNWFKESFLPILLANCSVWTPTVILIYVLPTQLQLPLQNLVLCFWGLIMAFMTAQAADATQADESAESQTPA